MTVRAHARESGAAEAGSWYARSPGEVATALGVDPAVGLNAARAAELLAGNGPNSLPEEKPEPGWHRFLGQYRSYMQIILIAAAVVSLAIKEWSTGVLLVLLTILNAVVGMRQEGKAESAMNALKSMMKFDPAYKLMATFNSAVDASGRPVVRCFVKGAAPAVMARTAWDAGQRETAQAHLERMESAGQRVMAAATRDLDPDQLDPDGDLLGYVTGLRPASLVGMVDPPREESAVAVAAAQAAHIRVRMVTGDDVITGAAIAKQLGIGGEAMLGADFAALPEPERLARIDGIGVVGRVAPEHKVLLADTLKKKGHVVAMTGDGVNDAPAIKAADIGIAMGTGTEVAKNAGRMILSDDNFATIVFAVEQGRKIYDNLTKYIRFVLVLLVAFVLTFLGATLFNIAAGEPFTPAQVLWVHFFVNAPFGFALGFDKETPGLMTLHPRRRGQSVLTTGMMVTVGLAGLAITIGLLSMILVGQHLFGSVPVGQSIAFTSFALCLIVAAVQCRSESGTALTTATFESKQMNWAMLGESVLAVLVTQMDVFNRLLGTTQINLRQFGWALVPAVALFIAWELGKYAARRRAPRTAGPVVPRQRAGGVTRAAAG